jgi:L-ribulose-5-phosphate 3-epimerase
MSILPSRRSFLATAATASAALAVNASSVVRAATPTTVAKPRVKLGIATYSYWHFRTEKVRVETVMDRAAELGVEGVDLLHRQMDIGERAPLDAAGRAHRRGGTHEEVHRARL